MRTVLTNATLVDCVQPRAVGGAAVVIEKGRIREIRTDGSAPEPGSGPSIDLGGAYLRGAKITATQVETVIASLGLVVETETVTEDVEATA